MKRFYNNTLIGGAFSKALRVVALLCVLLGFSSSAWGDTYYLWYNAKSNEPNYKDSNFTMSAGATLTNNKCVWTISNLRKDNSYFYISTSSTYSESDLKSVNIQTNYPNDAVVNAVGKQEYGGKVGFYVSCITASSTVTITIDFSSNSQYVVSPVGGGAAACTPSATITGASYDGTKITLSGTVTEVCTSSIATWYGWQYKTDVNAEWSTSTYIAGKPGSTQHQTTTAPVNYTNTWTGFEKGKTYYFRAYALQNSTWYSDNKILSVTIPNGGGSTGEADCSGVVYLDPTAQLNGGKWTDASAWFAIYYWRDSGGQGNDGWVKMNAAALCNGLYYAVIPEGYSNLKFVRMNSASDQMNWDNDWNSTGDLTLQQDKNCFNISDWGSGNWTTTDCTDGCTPAEQPSTNVLLSRQAIVNKSAKTAQLFGYLKATDCNRYTDYGFYYCMVNDGDAPCLPTTSSTKLAVSSTEELPRGKEFTATVNELQDGKTYYYRAYAKSDAGTILSGEIRSFSTDPCIPQYGGLSDKYNGKPIVYTINADTAFAANDCKLHFKSLQDAIDHLKKTKDRDNDYKYVDGSYNLLQPVEMRVVYYDDTPDDDEKAYAYRGTTAYGMTAGNVTPTNVNLIEDINKTASNSANTLTIKAGTSKAKPWIHHIVIRNSKNIVLDSLCIYSDPTGRKDNALEIDVNSTSWSNIQPNFENANIVIQNSIIGSAGFTGVHVSGYDGITFKGNEIEASFTADANQRKNTITWGASAKFVACKNIKFIQNNFRGSQPTLLWLQDSQNALFMNNVFWNTNTFLKENDNEVTPTAIKLVNQYGRDINKIGFFYNTFYFAENKIVSTSRYNFFTEYLAASDGSTTGTQYFKEHIYFQYNNCYSYDTDCPGKDAFVGRGSGDGDNVSFSVVSESSNNANFCPNNFWSQYDLDNNKTKSVFAFSECANTFTNVKTQVCETTASGPASLIVKGSAMNTGAKLSIEDIAAKTGIELTDKESKSDRYLIGARPIDDTWTIGAYQSKDNIDTKLIYWVGVTDDWDNRNNWEYETEVDGKMVRQRVSCVNNFSEDLKVVIEEIGTVEVAGGRKWPRIPSSFDADTRTEETKQNKDDLGIPAAEQVSAGESGKFASTIELEYGAGIKGVENLREADGPLRYDRAITHFDAPRDKWLLVGTVVKPFENEQTRTTRNVISRDYYMDFLPQVYMRQTVVDKDTISWTKTFPDLDTEVLSTTVYAINAVNKYGPSFQEAVDYNAAKGTNYDGTAPIPYTFTGRFAVEEERDNAEELYAFTINNGINLLNNNYPCNLDAKALEAEYDGTVNVYNYEKGAFESTSARSMTGNVYIKAQNGFVFTPNPENGQSKIEPSNFLVEGSTRTRSVERELPTFSLNVDNANTTQPGASNVVISYDQEQEAFFDAPLNTPKVFTKNLYTPEVYIINNDAFYSRLYVGNGVTQVPLGLRLLRAMNVTFQKVYNEQFTTMILVDTKTGKEYDLLARDYTTEKLDKGTIEGRFYLKFAVEQQDDFQEDDDFVTDITDVTDASINIYAVDQQIIKVIANDVELQTIYVNDMTGRMMRYDASGSYAELQLPVAQGVYLVHVIGDKLTRTEKVIVK